MPVLEIDDLTVEYRSADAMTRPIDGLSRRVAPGSLALLLGPSGCGKTSLLSALGGILTPTSGSIKVGGTEVTSLRGRRLTEYRRQTVGMIFQSFNLVPSLSAVENVAAPLWAVGTSRRVARSRATELLVRVGLGERLHHRPAALSGGQQQRVAVARALALDPPLILADEPTAHLDHLQVGGVVTLLRELADGERTVVVSTHDARLNPVADEVIDMVDVIDPAGVVDMAAHLPSLGTPTMTPCCQHAGARHIDHCIGPPPGVAISPDTSNPNLR